MALSKKEQFIEQRELMDNLFSYMEQHINEKEAGKLSTGIFDDDGSILFRKESADYTTEQLRDMEDSTARIVARGKDILDVMGAIL